jgi:protein involved in polysaccharide export with SLBB domain
MSRRLKGWFSVPNVRLKHHPHVEPAEVGGKNSARWKGLICALLKHFLSAAFLLVAYTEIASPQAPGQAGTSSGLLTTREELLAAESSVGVNGNPALAAAIRQRLRDGDFQVGDRVVVTVVSKDTRTDTIVVRSGPLLDLPGNITVPLTGVLRSELRDRVATEVLKYVKAQEINVTPLMRLGVLGEVVHAGYFSFASDIALSDAIMTAGGPTENADITRSTVRRANREYRSAAETQQAIARGLTPDQFGLTAGDELVIGRKRQFLSPTLMAAVGLVASVVTLFLAVQH